MKFNKVEMIAIMSMANAMIMADGKVEDAVFYMAAND